MASGYLNNGDSSSPPGFVLEPAAPLPRSHLRPHRLLRFVVEDAEPLSAAPLRHADGRLTEAGWQAERDALAGSRQKEIEGTSFWDNLVAGYGRSLPNLYQGAKQAYVDSVAGLSGTAADVLGDIGGETLGDARRGVASYMGDLSKELRQETNQERRDSQALTSSGGGILGGWSVT
ncbi:hypothetical protein SNK04_014410 [Fusarium graminearum]